MNAQTIRDAVKQAVAKVAKIDVAKIGDHESFRRDLGLDSLSFLETLVEVQYRFQIPDVEDNEYATITTIDDAVEFVERHLQMKAA